MKVLVTGAEGQLGYDICKVLKNREIEYVGVDINDFDITDPNTTQQYINSYAPDCVIHCSAYTAVDKAEDEPELCRKINVEGTRNIAMSCKETNAKMIYISSDYVFPGTGTQEYETNDGTGPLSVYGKSKLEGEEVVTELIKQHFIVRTSWVFGVHGNNFIKTMMCLAETRQEVSVVGDQIGSPTYTADLASLLCDMVATEKYGIYHATNEGFCSWADFAKEIFGITGKAIFVNYIKSNEYPTKAMRPLNSRLSKSSLDIGGFHRLPNWKNAFERFWKDSNIS